MKMMKIVMKMKIAINRFGDALIRDETGRVQIYKNPEFLLIGKAYYKYVQHKLKAGVYIDQEIL